MSRSICLLSLLLLCRVASGKTLFFKRIGNIECPDKEGSCPDGTTCCQLPSGKYGCCPFPDATCCDDHEHCCPSGYTCDVPDQKCVQENGDVISWSTKTPALSINNLGPESVVCPDQKSQCDDGQTCCQLSSGDWGCCPYPQAVCCDDYEHCCPNGYTCDVPDQQCLKTNGEAIPWSKKTEAKLIPKSSSSIICPDQQSQCGDGQTCCQLPSGDWGCCPYPQAVCCSDQEHCCPNGYRCDVPHQQCVKANGEVMTWLEKTGAKLLSMSSGSVICPDQQSKCGDGQTCCQLPSGDWGCCPYPQAVCCSDQEHCCPNGYQCDVPHQQCVKANGEAIPWSKNAEAKLLSKSSSSIICPDQQSQCGDGQTCCQLPSGDWGCCPYPQAVCCSDQEHCCPNGYQCDVPHEQCVKTNGDAIPWSKKTEASTISGISNLIVCPDGASMCLDGYTCCELQSGTYGCCPLAKAVCCSDHEHCCPSGYTCDVAAQHCNKGNGESLPWSNKVAAAQINNMKVQKKANNIFCPDLSFCNDGETCCLISSTTYGCCPLSQASCCNDFIHCCPHSYSCDLQKQTCVRGDGLEVPWSKKSPSKSLRNELNICQDQKTKCHDGSTCCSNSNGETQGCCPFENGVCCSDGLHCCPANSVCDAESHMCQSNIINMAISWRQLDKVFGAGFGIQSVNADIKCPDQKSECPAETTCCQMQSGPYGCCPFSQALCCEDKLHCCPSGFKCDTEHSRCVAVKSEVALPWEMFGRRRAKTVL